MANIIEMKTDHTMAIAETVDWALSIADAFKQNPDYDPPDPEAQKLLGILRDHSLGPDRPSTRKEQIKNQLKDIINGAMKEANKPAHVLGNGDVRLIKSIKRDIDLLWDRIKGEEVVYDE